MNTIAKGSPKNHKNRAIRTLALTSYLEPCYNKQTSGG